MANGKLDLNKDLKFGTLNAIEDVNVANSGDRRRTSSLSALNSTTSRTYGKNSLRRRQRFNGIIVHKKQVQTPRYQNRASLLSGYVASQPLEAGGEEAADGDGTTGNAQIFKGAPYTIYKVYVPELEPRPAPKSFTDPVLHTYPDIMAASGRADLNGLPLGAIVQVTYEDPNRLYNPQIVDGDKDKYIMMAGYEQEQANTELMFAGGVPGLMGDGSGATPLPGQPPIPGPDDPYPTKISDGARSKKRQAESVSLKLYNDPYGYCTIGIGHLVDGLNSCQTLKDNGSAKLKPEWQAGGIPPDGNNTKAPNETMTNAQAEALFTADIAVREKGLVNALKNANNAKVTQNQFDALWSAVFNAGQGNVTKNIIKPYLAQDPPDYKGAAEAFTVYGKMGYWQPGHERHLAGLSRLREKERALFYKA